MKNRKKKLKKQLKKGEKRSKKQTNMLRHLGQFSIVGFFLAGLGYMLSPHFQETFVKNKMAFLASAEGDFPVNGEREYDLPIGQQIIERNGYLLSYDGKNRIPQWVFERLTAEKVEKSATPLRFKVLEDFTIPKHLRATLADYIKSGYCSGNLCVSQGKAEPKAKKTPLYLTNTTPQEPLFAKGYWTMFENSIKEMTGRYKTIDVVTGSLFMPRQGEDGNRYVQYRVIGKHDIAVPTHFYKVLLTENAEGECQMQAYILPNEEIPLETPIDAFRTSILEVEKYSGLTFFNKMDEALKQEF
jgi:endonuclease G, mitochondrial